MTPIQSPSAIVKALSCLSARRFDRPLAYQIVGVDEADVARGKSSFISPIAKAMMDRAIGDDVAIKLPAGARAFELADVASDA